MYGHCLPAGPQYDSENSVFPSFLIKIPGNLAVEHDRIHGPIRLRLLPDNRRARAVAASKRRTDGVGG